MKIIYIVIKNIKMGNSHKHLKIKGVPFSPGQWFPMTVPFIRVGLGWDFHSGQVFDLDSSIVAFDECKQVITSIYTNIKTILKVQFIIMEII